MLQYGCFIRPGALSQLKFGDFNFQLGIIHVRDETVKTSNSKDLTIPADLLPLFVNDEFKSYHPNWFVFGKNCQPSAEPAHDISMRRRHLRYIRRLKEKGELEDIKGIQWYSWKDTGITDGLKQMKAYWVQKQADHQDFKTTLKYDHAGVINEGMRGFKIGF